MVNIEKFIVRLKKIIEENDLSSSAFAEKLGVQRATISHLLSGRNKPSLDFIMKVIEAFPEVDLYWLLNGKGSYNRLTEKVPSSPPTNTSIDLFTENDTEQKKEVNSQIETRVTNSNIINENLVSEKKDNDISKIIICYKNGSFDIFQND